MSAVVGSDNDNESEQQQRIEPYMVDGQAVIDTAKFNIPVRRQKLQLRYPARIARMIDVVVDSGS